MFEGAVGLFAVDGDFDRGWLIDAGGGELGPDGDRITDKAVLGDLNIGEFEVKGFFGFAKGEGEDFARLRASASAMASWSGREPFFGGLAVSEEDDAADAGSLGNFGGCR